MKEFCVDLELAKELKENGFIQNTHFYHRIQKDGIGEFTDFCDTKENSPFMKFKALYSAPISDEILKELPKIIIPNYTRYDINIRHFTNQHLDDYYEVSFISMYLKSDEEHPDKYIKFAEQKLPNALAEMWLYLKKEGYIK
jgi:hypothetical protein